jgi:hypothetical protein
MGPLPRIARSPHAAWPQLRRFDEANRRITYMSGLQALAHQCQREPMDWVAQEMDHCVQREVTAARKNGLTNYGQISPD